MPTRSQGSPPSATRPTSHAPLLELRYTYKTEKKTFPLFNTTRHSPDKLSLNSSFTADFSFIYLFCNSTYVDCNIAARISNPNHDHSFPLQTVSIAIFPTVEVFPIKSLNAYKTQQGKVYMYIFLPKNINGLNHGSDFNACLRAILSLIGYLGSREVVDEALWNAQSRQSQHRRHEFPSALVSPLFLSPTGLSQESLASASHSPLFSENKHNGTQK